MRITRLRVKMYIWGFPKIRVTIWGGPIMKDYSILQSILGSHGSPSFGKLRFIYKDMSDKPKVRCFEGIIYAQKDAVRN